MKQCRKRQKLNDEVTSRFANSKIRSIHANKRKLTFARDRPPEAMGEQPSKAGFCHNETMKEETKP